MAETNKFCLKNLKLLTQLDSLQHLISISISNKYSSYLIFFIPKKKNFGLKWYNYD